MKWEGFELLGEYVLQRKREFKLITQERKKQLTRLASAITHDLTLECSADLIFICTHNSRRSHMAHIWAQLSSRHYDLVGVRCYSGGTEATAFNTSAVEVLKSSGLHIEQLDEGDNPVYRIHFPGAEDGIRVFSKKYEDAPNPTNNFIAVMTCSDADEACPMVEGAASRFAITYDDPKAFDGTSEEKARYEERSQQIAREMLFLFSLV
jgi:arsenate reductase